MKMIKNSIGNLINKYRAVLFKCRLLNTIGTLAVIGALVLGMVGTVMADSGGNLNPFGLPDSYVGIYEPLGDATGGDIHIDTGGPTLNIYGGYTDAGDANNNSVTMTGGQVKLIEGGASGRGNANNNRVNISGGNIIEDVSGGHARLGNANGNLVNMSSGTAQFIYGGEIILENNSASPMTTGHIVGNLVNISGSTVQFIYGGDISVGGSGDMTTGDVTDNRVNISSSTVRNDIYGGRIFLDAGSGNMTTGDVLDNLVNMSGGTVRYIYGGYIGKDSSYTGTPIWGQVDGNRVNMSGGTAQVIYGGYSEGAATNNTVQYSGGYISESLYGGYTTASSEDNTLISIGNRSVGKDVSHFQNYRFVLDVNQNIGLTVGDTFTMDGTTNKILGVDIRGGGTIPKVGDTLTLVKANGALTPNIGITAGSTGTGKKGATLLFDYNVDVNGNNLDATVTNVRANPQAKSLSEGVAANAAIVNIGADAVAGSGMASALAASVNNAPVGTTSLAPFGTMQAGSSRFETGSHVNVSGLNLIAGIALGQQTEIGKLIIGPFFEAGFGSYNTYNSFDNAASVNGEGRTNFLGAGILARFDFADITLGHPYLEGSFRFGHAFNTYNNEDLADGLGNSVDYDTDAPYQSFHAGLGYIFNLTETDHFDLYGKYFWSHMGGSDVKVLGDPIEFDDVHSSRLRFGGRYSHDFVTDKNYFISPYIGVAYEHEFDGKARATTYGQDIKAPSLKGDTGIGELGVTFKHQNGLSLDLGLSGYVGKRQGVVGNMMVKYEF